MLPVIVSQLSKTTGTLATLADRTPTRPSPVRRPSSFLLPLLTCFVTPDVFAFVANATSYQNNDLTTSNLPLLNLTGTIPGPLNPDYFVPWVAPNTNGTGGGSGPTFVAPNVNTSLTSADAPPPVNLTANSSSGSSPTTTTGAGVSVGVSVQGVLGAAVVVAAVLLV
jgi:hypothetical protein